jgi:hypothetical protein
MAPFALSAATRTRSPLALLATAAAITFARDAGAAPPWVDRRIVLPRHDFSFDAGLSVAHLETPGDDLNGVGLNLEAAFGITERLELGFRTGLRFGDDGRITSADFYARLWDTDTYDVGTETFANPEARLRYAILGGDVVELGLEARMYLPIAENSEFGVAPGLPVAFHLGEIARLDTGVLVPIILSDPDTTTIISIPARLWFQVSQKAWLGPLSGVRVVNDANGNNDTQVPLGFGFGYQISQAVDLKTQFLFRDVDRNDATDDFGVGAGLQFRIE